MLVSGTEAQAVLQKQEELVRKEAEIEKKTEEAVQEAVKKARDRESEWNELRHFLGIADEDRSKLSEATYFACLKVLSESVGKMPLKLQQHAKDGHGVKTLRNHPVYRLIHDRPNPYQTASSFWASVEMNRNHFGNAYVWIQGGGKDMRLWLLPSNQVEVWYDNGRILSDVEDVYYVYTAGGKRYMLTSEEVLHFKSSNCLDGLVGKSVRDQLNDTVGGAQKSQKMLNEMYDTGFSSRAVVQYTGDMSPALEQNFIKNIQRYLDGDLAGKGVKNLIPLPLGTDIKPLNMKLSDSQFLELRKYSALQIASAFGIKPYQIGDYTKSSYASAEAQQLSFYVDTLLFILTQYEQEITYKLLSDREISKGYHCKFNTSAVLRADQKTMIETLANATKNGIYTSNEARGFLDMESKPGGDRLLGNGNLIPLELAGSQYIKVKEGGDNDGESEGAE